MWRRVLSFAFATLVTATLEAGSVTLAARDDGFATDVPTLVPARGWQALSDLAVHDGVAYVAWYDHVPSPRGLISRVDPDGTLLDPVGIPVGGFSTRIVPDGDGVRLFWVAVAGPERVLQTARVSRDGSAGEAEDVIRVPAEPSWSGFDVAQGGSGMSLVAIGPHLVLLDGVRVVRQVTLTGWGDPTRVLAVEGVWVVAWVASGGYAMWESFDEELSPLGPAGGRAVSDGVSQIDLAGAGEAFLYAVSGIVGLDVWQVDPASGRSTRIVELDTAFTRPNLTRLSDERFLLSFPVNGGIEGAEVSNGVIGPAKVLVPYAGFDFDVAEWQGGLLIVDSRGGCFRGRCELDVHASIRFTPRETNLVLSKAAARQSWPSVTVDGDSFLAAWRHDGGVPVVAWGVSRNGEPFPVHEHDPGSEVLSPQVAVSGDRRMVLWATFDAESGLPVFDGFLLDETGTPTEPLRIAAPSVPGSFALAGGPSGWLVAWLEWTSEGGRLAALRLDRDGRVVGEEIVIASRWAYQVAVVANQAAGGYVIVWTTREGETEPWTVRTARVTTGGQAIIGNDLAASYVIPFRASVGCLEARCLAVWAGVPVPGDGREQYDVIGRVFEPSGLTTESGLFAIASAPLAEASPRVASTGLGWVVAWTEREDDSAGQFVRAARVDRQVSASGSVVVGAATAVDFENHAIACRGSECLSLRVLTVDDPVRGRTEQLMRSWIRESRRHPVRPDERFLPAAVGRDE
jgi:hypothetical protein